MGSLDVANHGVLVAVGSAGVLGLSSPLHTSAQASSTPFSLEGTGG